MKLMTCCVALCGMGILAAGVEAAHAATVKLTGWFACDKCTAARVANGDIRPSNPICAKQCIENGSEAVFISEQAKQSLKVKKYTSATEDLGYRVEVTGEVDPTAKTISIDTVKRLSYMGASCSRPKSAPKK